MEKCNTIEQRFDYKNKKRTLIDVIEKFDKFCKLTKLFYEPIMSITNKSVHSRLLVREKNIGTINKTLNELVKCYEQPVKAYFDFGMENYKSNFSKDESYDEDILFYFFLDKVDRYSSILNFFSIEHVPLWWVKIGLSNLISKNPQKLSKLGISDYVEQCFPNFKEVLKLHKEISEGLIDLQQSSWEEVLDILIGNISLLHNKFFKKIDGNSNVLAEFDSYMPSSPFSFVIKAGKKDSDSLRSEKEITQHVNEIISQRFGSYGNFIREDNGFSYTEYGHPFKGNENDRLKVLIKLPKIIFFSDKISSEYNWLVLRNETKSKKITEFKLSEEQKGACLNSIMDFLAYIHVMTPVNISQKGNVDISCYIKNHLNNKFLDLKEDLRLKIYENLTPILDCLVKSPYSINKDAHPDNFLVYKPEESDKEYNFIITAIDWEDKGFQPVFLDLVNLLEYRDEFSADKKENYLKEYIRHYNYYDCQKKRKPLMEDQFEYDSNFKLSYLNSIIYRSLCFSSAWSNPGREQDSKRRTSMLNKAIKAIDDIKEEHIDYYNQYKKEYDSLKEALNETICMFLRLLVNSYCSS